jgi:hypothetical protein
MIFLYHEALPAVIRVDRGATDSLRGAQRAQRIVIQVDHVALGADRDALDPLRDADGTRRIVIRPDHDADDLRPRGVWLASRPRLPAPRLFGAPRGLR